LEVEYLSKFIELLEFAVFDRGVIGSVDAVIMVEVAKLALKVFCRSWLVDSFNIPARWFGF
jgi:hypothetical protein